jgi:hypothetical protein
MMHQKDRDTINNALSEKFPKTEFSADIQSFAQEVITEQRDILAGQELKIQRMELFVQQMSAWVEIYGQEIIAEKGLEPSSAEAQAPIQKLRKMVVDATRAITYQDGQASQVTIGDHGWMHLTQDLRDAVRLAEGMQPDGQSLSTKKKLMLGLVAAYHDIGYSSDSIAGEQQKGPQNYSVDKGHPLQGYVYLQEKTEEFAEIFGQDGSRAILMSVLNHENPERADMAGAEYADVSKAFALADANAAFGPDKLPPVVAQFPETVGYLATFQLVHSLDQEIANL